VAVRLTVESGWRLSGYLNRAAAREGWWRPFKRGLQTVHLWAGLILCIPIVLIGISGSALLVQSEYLKWSVPSAAATGPKDSIAHAIAAAQAVGPANASLGRVDLSLREGEPVIVQLQPPGRRVRPISVFVDPVSLQILGTEEVVNRGQVLAFLISVHAFLMMKPYIGLKVVGWLGVVMTFMGFSGLVLWWPKKGRWRRAFLVRRSARGLPLNLDLHHAAGIWSLLVFLAMSISGIYLCFPETFTKSVDAALPSSIGSGQPVKSFVPTPGPLDADAAVGSAVTAVRDARAVGVQMPEQEGRPIVVYLETTRLGGATQPPILVTFDEKTGAVGYVDDPRYYGMAETVLNLQNVLHFGVGLGLVWKILVFVSGLLPLFFAVTGFNIWWIKRRVTRRAATAAAATASAPAE
jgi:uncharacterized iron-regulated membrane protein